MSTESRTIAQISRPATLVTTPHMPRTLYPCLASLAAAALWALPASAGPLASATVSTSSTSAPYNYTITLNNTGTTDIGTFWFAWTDTPGDYDFLPSSPTNTVMPAGWIAPITHNGFPGDGYGLEFYNLTGSPIAAGGSATFKFTSSDSPATIAGNAYFPGNKVTTSFVYIGFPQTDPGFEFNAKVVPEPASFALAGVGGAALLIWLRYRRRASASR
jgi:hypothetical protein